ncbi:FIST signal transduction protein [Aquimarina sp. W85]|uniref:FIST signal transduction protein n=1 Tax=Aquimarina rhodophyticola TaxID=3342246 RepID=UPI00366F3F57
MIIKQYKKLKNESLADALQEPQHLNNPLVLVFGNRFTLEDPLLYNQLRNFFPNGSIVFGSSAGEIMGNRVYDDSLTITAIEFEKSRYEVVRENILDHDKNTKILGERLGQKMPKKGLRHIFILSEGSFINGSSLIEGLELSNQETRITGGLCGDDARFEKTMASYNESPKQGEVIAIGLYGETLEITHAQYGGWKPFGPERIVTKSKANILYELDNFPALDLYKRYLGEKSKELPQAALLYPLRVKTSTKKESFVRTILSIDDSSNTMILAGDVPEGATVQLMMASIDNIADGALKAAEIGMLQRKTTPELAIVVSCIGRKLVMDQRVEEEIEEVIEVIGDKATVCGFYSYGELAPFNTQQSCELHNQTMTLTLISE